MTPISLESPKAQIERQAFAQQATSGQPDETLATCGNWKGKSRNRVRGIPNPFYYLWKFGPLVVGTGLLLMARACSAQVSQRPCLKLIRHDPRCEPMRLERAWQIDNEPEEVRMLSLHSDKIYEVSLDGVKPGRVNSRTITPSFLANLAKPRAVNLNDMTLIKGIFFNKTPYTVHGLYVQHSSVTYVDFATPIQGYTAVNLGCEFSQHRLVDSTTIGNISYDLAPVSCDEHPQARAVNAKERRWVERMQIYQRYWVNSPERLCEISGKAAGCVRNGEYLPYSQKPCGLNSDFVNLHPVSGITVELLVDPSLTTGMYADEPTIKISRCPTDFSFSIRISPKLIEGGSARISPESVHWAAKSLVHHYRYEPSSLYLYDRYTGSSSQAFPDYPGDAYTPSNLAVTTNRLGGAVYRFELNSPDTVSDLRMRLISYQMLSVRIMLSDKNTVYLEFDKALKNDVCVSFYSRESDQMASVSLSEHTKEKKDTHKYFS